MSIVLSGTGSVLSCDFFPIIELSETDEWEIGLIDFATYNSIPNITAGVNNKLRLASYSDAFDNDNVEGVDTKASDIVISIPTGSYEIEDIEKYINTKLPSSISFSLKPNNNTLKVEIKCSRAVHFEDGSIGNLLGFKNGKLAANIKHESDLQVDIIKVNVIRIECNIVTGSFQNGTESHVMHEFYPQVPPGYKIVDTPPTIIYLPVKVKNIHNITVRLTDQNGAPIDFRGETVSVRLHLRRRINGSRY